MGDLSLGADCGGPEGARLLPLGQDDAAAGDPRRLDETVAEHRRRHQQFDRRLEAARQRPDVDPLGDETDHPLHPFAVAPSDVREIGEPRRRDEGVVRRGEQRQPVERRAAQQGGQLGSGKHAASENDAGERHAALGDQGGGEDRVGTVPRRDDERAGTHMAGEQLLGRARRDQGRFDARRLDVAALQDLESEALGDIDDARRRQARVGDHRRQHRDGLRLTFDFERSRLGQRRRRRWRAVVDENADDRAAPFVAVLFDPRGGSDGEIAGIAVARRDHGNDVGAERFDHLDVEARGDLNVDFGNEAFDNDHVAGRAHRLDPRDDLFHQRGEISGADEIPGMVEGDRIRGDLAAQGAGEVDGKVAVALHRLRLEDGLEVADPHPGQSQSLDESQRHRGEPDLLRERNEKDGVPGG